MATTGKGDKVNPNIPSPLITDRVYEEFKPKLEWRKEDNHCTLLVYLPGFEEKNIKVTTKDLNRVTVRGERLNVENKWSRFEEDYQLPENCTMRGFRANFENGILTITVPTTKGATHSDLLRNNDLLRNVMEGLSRIDEMCAHRHRTNDHYWWPKLPKPGGRYEWRNQPTASYAIQVPILENLQPETTLLDYLFRRKHKTKEQPFGRTKQEEALPNPREEPKEKNPQTSLYTFPPKTKPTSSSTTTEQEPFKPAPEAKPVPMKEKDNMFEKPSVGGKTELDPKRSLEKHNVFEKPVVGAKTDLDPKSSCMPLVNAGVGLLIIVALGIQVSYTSTGK